MKTNHLLLSVVLVMFCVLHVSGAEIRLKPATVKVDGTLVTLGDVADVVISDNETVALKQTILFPAPADGEERIVTRNELRSILSQLGIDGIKNQITGAAKVTVLSNGGTSAAAKCKTFVVQQANFVADTNQNNVVSAVYSDVAPKVEGQFIEIIEKQVGDALNVYLNFTNKIDKVWEVSLKLTPDQARLLASNGQIKEITGGNIPFTGIQQFTIRMQTNVSITVEASVKLPKEVVILRRSVPKGHIISENDLMIKKVEQIKSDDFIIDLNEAVGMETTKAVMELNPLTKSVLQMPVLVRKGEVITVRAANHGIVVRTEATALQDGVLGDTITVAKIDMTPKSLTPGGKNRNRKDEPVTYLVRVCAPKTGEVFVN
ncbi:hypothetical protein FACS1894170_07320 [Planctomycetales bacterium]|nr:hypothetical protein FACS1894170_07320 [Planctomycetales bacterium]